VARFSAGWRTAGIGSATLPIASLYAQATTPLWVVEVGCVNTTTTAVSMALRVATTTGTQGASKTVFREENDTITLKGDPRDTHSVLPTLLGTLEGPRVGAIGASVGSGNVWVFGGRGFYIPPGTANGLCLIPLVAPGQICDVWFVWDA
jgi:hypothetical protein